MEVEATDENMGLPESESTCDPRNGRLKSSKWEVVRNSNRHRFFKAVQVPVSKVETKDDS